MPTQRNGDNEDYDRQTLFDLLERIARALEIIAQRAPIL